jgi:hypothetical protein
MPIRPGRFLPRDPRVDAPYRLTPQLMFRIGILGFLVLAAFGVLFVRLWSLQVLSGNEFLVAARQNQFSLESTEAPRGPVKDRHGRVLVDNASATAIKITPAFLPKRGQYAELRRLARILQVPLSDVTDQIEKHGDDRLTKVVVKEAASRNEVFFLKEHKKEFPGMTIEDTSIRRYPYGDLAAHVLGYVGEISDEQLKQLKGYKLGDRIGQGGIEASFDKELRGTPGIEQKRVDALGQPTGPREPRQLPVAGYGLRLTLDAKLQRSAQQAVIDGINRAQADRKWYAKAGAVVALDPRDGAIRALASYPTYDPTVFTRRRKSDLARLGYFDPDVARPRDRRLVPAGLDVQAGDRARGDAGAHPHAVQLAALHRLVHRRRAEVQQLGPRREPDDDAADRARPVVRHVLLPSRQGVLRPPARPRPASPEVGQDLRLRTPDRCRRRARNLRAPADDQVEAGDVHERDRPGQLADRPDLEVG